MKHIIIYILLLAATMTMQAKTTKAEADTLYNRHHYEQAERAYAELLKANPQSAQLLYNMGNCHYRLKNMGRAILYYERAAKINPSDADVRHNLALARAQTEDKLYSADDLDIVYSFSTFVNTLSSDGWAWVTVVAIAVLLAMIVVMRFSGRPVIKKIAFGLIILMALLVVASSIFAYIQRSKYDDHSAVIVMKTTKLMSTPDTTATVVTTLHEGTKAYVSDTTISAWTEVSVADGHKGWIAKEAVEDI